MTDTQIIPVKCPVLNQYCKSPLEIILRVFAPSALVTGIICQYYNAGKCEYQSNNVGNKLYQCIYVNGFERIQKMETKSKNSSQ